MIDCRLESNHTWGIFQNHVMDSWGADIQGGKFSNNLTGGANLSVLAVSLDGITISGNGGPGLWLFESDYVTNVNVANCLVADNTGDGIHIVSGSPSEEIHPLNVSLSHNTIANNDGHAIAFDSDFDRVDLCLSNTLRSYSPCTAENNQLCGQIGALGVGCEGQFSTVVISPAINDPIPCNGTTILDFDYLPPLAPDGLKGYSIRIVAQT